MNELVLVLVLARALVLVLVGCHLPTKALTAAAAAGRSTARGGAARRCWCCPLIRAEDEQRRLTEP